LPWLVVSNFIKLIFKTLRQMLLLTSEEWIKNNKLS
jgi:hypothetical protein